MLLDRAAHNASIAAPIALLESEVRKPAPDNSKLREGLSSLRKIAESVTGN
jgi:hypothetical protein